MLNPLEELLNRTWSSKILDSEWEDLKDVHSKLELPAFTGGVNPGDQRAIYYLIKGFDISSVLEIGTHLGCSTVSIALALKGRKNVKLTTVDIRDVNDKNALHDEKYIPHDFRGKSWHKFKSKFTPKELVEKIDCDSFVDFKINDSIDFFKKDKNKYDFIFLDGNHDFEVVYEELPLAIEHLNKNGLILLHDYFLDLKPLWKESDIVCSGPFKAVAKLFQEGLNFYVQPCGSLPWEVKYKGEHVTSLALGAVFNELD